MFPSCKSVLIFLKVLWFNVLTPELMGLHSQKAAITGRWLRRYVTFWLIDFWSPCYSNLNKYIISIWVLCRMETLTTCFQLIIDISFRVRPFWMWGIALYRALYSKHNLMDWLVLLCTVEIRFCKSPESVLSLISWNILTWRWCTLLLKSNYVRMIWKSTKHGRCLFSFEA